MMIGLYKWTEDDIEWLDIFMDGVRTTGGMGYEVNAVSYQVSRHFADGYRTQYATPSEFETAVMITPKEYL